MLVGSSSKVWKKGSKMRFGRKGAIFFSSVYSQPNAPHRRPKEVDYRVRDDRTQRLVEGWNSQMGQMVVSYMDWCEREESGRIDEAGLEVGEEYEITIVGLHGMFALFCSSA